MSKNEFYQSIVEQTSVGYSYNKIIYDQSGKPIDYEFIEMNNAYESMIGIQEEEWIGKRVSELYNSVNKNPLSWEEYNRCIFRKHMEENNNMNFKYLEKHYRVKIHSPKKDYLIVSLTDISVEVGKTEQLQTLFDSVPIQVWYLKDSNTYLSANEAHANFHGLNRDELVKMTIKDRVSKESGEICIAGNTNVFRQKKQIVTEEWLPNLHGENRLLRITKNPKVNTMGEIEFVICSAEDITEDYRNKQAKEIQERILCASINFTQELLTNKNPEEALANGIEMLGNATKVDRVYYWENYYDDKTNQSLTSSKIEWYLNDTERANADFQYQDLNIGKFTDFIKPLAQNKPISFHTKDLKQTSFTKKFLESQRIYSVLTLPVFSESEFVGFIGFDSYNQEREWTEVEISLLNSFVLLYEKAIERTRLEQDIKQKNENLFNFFNRIQDLLVVLDYEGTILDVNSTLLERLNYTREELIGASYLKLHPKDEIDLTTNQFINLITKEEAHFQLNLITKDGDIFPIETANSKGIWNGEPVIFAVAKDISELALSEDKFSKAFNNSGISMFISRFDDGTLLEVNDNFLEFFGYQKDEVLGKTTLEIKITRFVQALQILFQSSSIMKNVCLRVLLISLIALKMKKK